MKDNKEREKSYQIDRTEEEIRTKNDQESYFYIDCIGRNLFYKIRGKTPHSSHIQNVHKYDVINCLPIEHVEFKEVIVGIKWGWRKYLLVF